MQALKHISIPQPCGQNWNNMTPVEQGRHCLSCNKTVIDFTTMSNDEIIDYLSNHQTVCGKFGTFQLSQINSLVDEKQKGKFLWKQLAIAASLIVLHPSAKAEAKNEPKLEQGQVVGVKSDIITHDSLRRREIRGNVSILCDNTPIAGAIVSARGMKFSTTTLNDGTFKLKVPTEAKILAVSYPGYESQDLTITLNKSEYNFLLYKLSDNERTMTILGSTVGGIYIKRQPFYVRWWYKLKRIF